MSIRIAPVLGLALAGLVAAAAAPAPAVAQAPGVIAPTEPFWARALGLQTGREFRLRPGSTTRDLARFNEPRTLRICVVSGTTPASQNLDARVISDGRAQVIPVGHCRDLQGRDFTVEPAGALGGAQRVTGRYDLVG
jgi:hypothetical protein